MSTPIDGRAGQGPGASLPAIVIPARRPAGGQQPSGVPIAVTTPQARLPASSPPPQPSSALTPASAVRAQSFEEPDSAPSSGKRERALSSPEIGLSAAGARPPLINASTPIIDIGLPKQTAARLDPNVSSRGQSPASAQSSSLSPSSFPQQQPFGPLSPTTIALQDLFAEFTHMSDQKIATLSTANMPMDRDVDLSYLAKPGNDPAFDRLCLTLGSLGKFAPRVLIDSLMAWRKLKGDQADLAVKTGVGDLRLREVLRERKSLVGNFLVCRLLYEILQGYKHADQDLELPEDLGGRIEEMVFAQIRTSDPDVVAKSVNRQTNIDMFAELTGPLSLIRFTSVGDRFISELNRVGLTKDAKVEQIVRAMRFMRFKIYPMDSLEATADFLQVIAVSFQNAHTTRGKHAFAEVLVELLEPVAVVASADANFPSWTRTVDMLYPRAFRMAQKPRHFHVAIPLLTTLLSVAPKSFFLNHWPSLVELIVPKLKERAMPVRRLALSCWVRLVWLYVFRCPDSQAVLVNKRLDATFRTLFPARGRGIVPPETMGASDALSRLIVYVGARYWDYAIDGLVLPLLNYESISNSNLLTGSASWISGVGNASISTVGSSLGSQASLQSPATGSAASLIVGNDTENAFDKLMTTYEHLLSPERQSISLRAFYSILAELEAAFTSSQQSGGMTHAVTRSVHRGGAASEVSRAPAPLPQIQPLPMPLLVEITPTGSGKSVSGEWDFLRRASSSVVTATGVAVGATVVPKHTEKYRTRTATGDLYRDNISAANVSLPAQFWVKAGQHVRDGYDKVTVVLGRLIALLDNLVGSLPFSTDSATLREAGAPLTNQPSAASVVQEQQPATRSLSSAVISATTSFLPGSLRRGASQVSLSSANSTEELDTMGKDMPRNKAMLIDLLRTCIDGLPRCTPRSLGSTKLLEMLSKYTMHADEGLRKASLEALRRVLRCADPAERRWWLGIETAEVPGEVAKFASLSARVARIFVDSLLWTANERIGDFIALRSAADDMESGGPQNASSLLMFVGELAEEWCKELSTMPPPLDRDLWSSALDEIEQWGLIMFCSSSVAVRRLGIRLLRLAASALPQELSAGEKSPNAYPRILSILEASSPRILALHDPATSDERDLLAIARAPSTEDQAMWFKCFPDMARELFLKASPNVLAAVLENVSRRIAQLQPNILVAAELSATTAASSTFASYRSFLPGGRSSESASTKIVAATDETILQWRLYIVFACCLADTAVPTVVSPSVRQTKPELGAGRGTIYTARQLFQLLLPLLAAEKASIRLAAVTALGSVHANVFGILYQEAQPLLRTVLDEGLARVASQTDSGGTVRSLSLSTPRRSFSFSASGLYGGILGSSILGRRADRLRAEIAQLFSLTVGLLRHEECGNDAFLVQGLLQYLVETARFLADPIVQAEWDHQMLRYYFSSFVQKLYETLALSTKEGLIARAAVTPVGPDGASHTKREHDPRANKANELVRRMMSYEIRHVLFKLIENWCGYGPPSLSFRDRQSRTIVHTLDSLKDQKERPSVSTAMEEQRKALELASCRALWALCRGNISAESTAQEAEGANRAGKVLMEPSVVDELRNLAAVLGIYVNGQTLPFDVDALLQFVDATFSFSEDKFPPIAIGSLEALLGSNPNHPQLVEKAVRQAYGQRTVISARGYYLALARVFSQINSNPIGLARLVALSLVKMSDAEVVIRREAYNLLLHLASIGRDPDSPQVALLRHFIPSAAISETPQTVLFAQAMMSTALALTRPELTAEIVSELTFWSDSVAGAHGQGGRHHIRDLFAVLIPWARNAGRMNVPRMPTGLGIQFAPSQPDVIANLFSLTARFGEECVVETQRLWTSYIGAVDPDLEASAIFDQLGFKVQAASPDTLRANVSAVCEFLLTVGAEHRNPLWTVPAKRTIVAVCRSTGFAALVDELTLHICPSNMIPGHIGPADTAGSGEHTAPSSAVKAPPAAALSRNLGKSLSLPGSSSSHVADIAKIIPKLVNGIPVSLSQLASVLLGEILPDLDLDSVVERLPLLLHMGVIHLDQMGTYLGEEHRKLLLNIIRILFGGLGAAGSAVSGALESALDKPRFWSYEDVSPDSLEIPSFRLMANLVYEVANTVSVVDSSIIQRWGDLALAWSILCPVRHIACRSLQVYRTLLPPTPVAKLGELLLRLSRAISDSRTEAQGFATEVLITLDSLFDAMDSDQFLEHPQFFWVMVAVLSTPHDWEFDQGLASLERILKFTDLQDPDVQDLIYQSLPSGWSGSFSGLQPLLLRGLRSPRNASRSLEIINSLLSINLDALVDLSQGRMLFTVLANLPNLLMAMNPGGGASSRTSFAGGPSGATIGRHPDDANAIHHRLAAALRERKQDLAAQLIESCTKPRYFRTKEDFLRNLLPLLVETYPTFVWEAFTFLLSLLQIPDTRYRGSVLQVLKALVGCANLRQFSDSLALEHALIPLYQAARSDCSDLAIEVLNELAARDRHDLAMAGSQSGLLVDSLRTPSTDNTRSSPPSSASRAEAESGNFETSALLTRSNLAAVAATFAALEPPIDENGPTEPHPSTPILATGEIAIDVSLVDLIAGDFANNPDAETDSPLIDSEDRLVFADELIGRHLRGEPGFVGRHLRTSTSSSVVSQENPSPPLLSASHSASVPASPGSYGSQDSLVLPTHNKTLSQASTDSL